MNRSLRLMVGTAGLAAALAVPTALAQQYTVDVNRITASGVGEKIGTITIADGRKGVSFKVAVSKMPAGIRGFHVHEKGDCGPGMKDGKMQAGIAAGEHYDPDKMGTHKGPKGAGHKGDLPALRTDNKGTINRTVTAPRLKVDEIKGRALVIHEGGDTYKDQPESGGGKGRIACGVVPSG
jgi:Cu-Zn family superoxide dismutase